MCLKMQTCNEFLAGDVLRSANRYKALDETALFGCACRHEFPLMFINLKNGERCTCIVIVNACKHKIDSIWLLSLLDWHMQSGCS